MKLINQLIALTCVAFLLTACGESTTDEPLPDGTAPSDVDRTDAPAETADPVDTPDVDPDPVSDADPDITTSTESDRDILDPDLILDDAVGDAERLSISGMTYVLPEGWSVGPPKTMRLLTLIPEGQDGAELAVSRWPGDVGGFASNVQRWVRQAGLPPIPGLMTAAASDFEKFDIDGTQATWIPLMNEDTNQAILAVWVPLGENPENPDQTWTFKLTCKADQVQALAPGVRAWCESIKFE